MIRIHQLTKKFGKLVALHKIDLACASGQCIALIGPNGCGKTTLIKCILGMVIPTNGHIEFNGLPIKQHWQYRSRIGYMPQIGRYPDNMTIGQLFDMMKDIRSTHQGELDEELIHSFKLNELMSKRMRTLSGGTRQKVSAALAFLFNAEVLILDEPTAGLDPISSEILKEKIIKEKNKGKLILITSHILSELDDIISHVIYIQEGKLIFYKDKETLQSESGEHKLSKSIARIMQQAESNV
jgi:Cu-processing system ATP-binding protein